VARRVIDLSQPLSRDSQLHPFFPTVQIHRHMLHADAAPGAKSFDAEIIITSNHAATHVDALSHFDPTPGAPKIADMPLDTFCGEAVCVDVRQYPAGHEVTVAELEQALADGGLEVGEGDILLFCTDHYNRTAGTPAFLDGFSGVAAECVHWMADRGVKIFGVETISPDLVYQTDGYPNHRACAERGISHYENLNNLKDVVNRRFEFYGFPLRLVPAAGSPVRAVGILEE
jgi:kynurenine formamidase